MKIHSPCLRKNTYNADDQTLPLINIAFLLLIFFLLVGTLSISPPFPIDDLSLDSKATTRQINDRLIVSVNGQISYRGQILDQVNINSALFADHKKRLIVQYDSRMNAINAITILKRLELAGVNNVRLIGVRGER